MFSNSTNETGRGAMIVVLSILAFFALVIMITIFSMHLYGYTATKQAQIDNQVYHASAQYTDGMNQRLEQLQESYIEAQGNHNQAGMNSIRNMVVHEFAPFRDDQIANNDLRTFLEDMRSSYNSHKDK
jgi:hypothetical protein